MKTVLLFLLLTVSLIIKSFGQSISNPVIDRSDEADLIVMDVVYLSNSVAVHFAFADTKEHPNQATYIFLASPSSKEAMFIVADGKRYNLLKTEGIANKPKQMYVEYRRIYEFTAYFEKLPYGVNKINIIEGDAGNWNFFGLHLDKSSTDNSQTKRYTTVQMEKDGGVYIIPCKINGLSLKFVFDTGASDVSISLTEAIFMLKNGYLSREDIGKKEYYKMASGSIVPGTQILIRSLEIGNKVIYNVEASVVNERDAPLLLGQSALNKIGLFEFDFNNSSIKFLTELSNDNGGYDNSGQCTYETRFDSPSIEPPLRSAPNIDSSSIYSCPKNSVVCVLERSSGVYYKVRVNGRIGYVSKGLLSTK